MVLGSTEVYAQLSCKGKLQLQSQSDNTSALLICRTRKIMMHALMLRSNAICKNTYLLRDDWLKPKKYEVDLEREEDAYSQSVRRR